MAELKTYWDRVSGEVHPLLAQGDYLPECLVPDIGPDFAPEGVAAGDVIDAKEAVDVRAYDLIIVTQSCDLENKRAPLVALCPIYGLREFEAKNASMKGKWNEVRKGKIEGLHLVSSFDKPSKPTECQVVNFREVYSLPVSYLERRATRLSERWRLSSPFLEHFSQGFARFFMRVGLPSQLPEFSKQDLRLLGETAA